MSIEVTVEYAHREWNSYDHVVHIRNHQQLQAKIAELEEENARLKAAVEYAETIRVENIAYFEKQLATSQLRETQLREALESCFEKMRQMCLNGEWYDPDKAIDLAWNALALPHDTSALGAYVAEKVKEIIESHAPEGRNVTNAQHVEMRHKFMDQIATLTRQRDLAVEALEWALSNINCEPFEWSDEENADAHKAAIEALSAIKESEAMAQGEKK